MATIKNFVNIDIKHQDKYTELGTRPTIILFDNSFTKLTDGEIYTEMPDEIDDNLKAYFEIFFDNGGSQIKVIKGKLPTTEEGFKALGNDYIVLVSTEDFTKTTFDSTILDNLKGIDRKIVLLRKTSDTFTESSPNVAIKVSNVIGAEISMGAYLSQIDVYDEDKVNDYDFTIEYDIEDDFSSSVSKEGSLSTIPYNFEMKIVDSTRNVGGNMTDTNSMVEEYITIIMQQTLSYTLINALGKKLKGQAGISAIRTALCEELNKYVASGFLVSNKIWQYNDLVAKNPVDSSVEKVVIKKNTPISSGYYLYFFPLANDSREVGVFLVIATAKGIRYIAVDGRAI